MPAIRTAITAIVLLTGPPALPLRTRRQLRKCGSSNDARIRPPSHDTAPCAAEEDLSSRKRFGRPSLLLPDGFCICQRRGDFKTARLQIRRRYSRSYPNSAFFGVAFHVQSPDKYELVFFRPGSTTETVQYAPSFMNMNEWRLFSGPEYTASRYLDPAGPMGSRADRGERPCGIGLPGSRSDAGD